MTQSSSGAPPAPEADPTPLAIAGFSSAVLMVSVYSAGWIDNLDWLPPLGLMAGFCLLLGSVHNLRHAHTFPATTFGVYGAFWVAVSISAILQQRALVDVSTSGATGSTHIQTTQQQGGAESPLSLTYIRIPLAIFTVYAWICSLYLSKASTAIFTFLELEYILFIAGQFTGMHSLTKAGAYFGIVCAGSGFYVSASALLRPFVQLPLGRPFLPLSQGNWVTAVKKKVHHLHHYHKTKMIMLMPTHHQHNAMSHSSSRMSMSGASAQEMPTSLAKQQSMKGQRGGASPHPHHDPLIGHHSSSEHSDDDHDHAIALVISDPSTKH